jgi:hypothetical protein
MGVALPPSTRPPSRFGSHAGGFSFAPVLPLRRRLGLVCLLPSCRLKCGHVLQNHIEQCHGDLIGDATGFISFDHAL